MKASILFIFLALSTTGNSQRNQRVNGETVPNDTLKWKADLVSTLKLLDFDWAPDPFTFYIGVDNPYTIIGKGFDQESMKATISSGSITKVEKNKFIIRVSAIEENIVFRLYADKNGKPELINESLFKSRNIPYLRKASKPLDHDKHNITIEEINTAPLKKLLNIPEDAVIKSWTFTIDTENKIISIDGLGDRLTESMRALISSGKMITFDKIRVEAPGRTVLIPAVTWYVD